MAVVIETTLGDITVDLFIEQRPQTCKNFLKLCKVKYYNFCLFHCIQPNFIAQTGDPTGIGTGGESIYGLVYGEESKYYEGEKMPKIKHSKPGLLSMVNYGNNMLGSQFFVTLGTELKSLEEHCVFAEVTEGHDILIKLNDAICDNQHRPYQDIRITHTVILEDPFDDLPGLVIPDASPDISSIQASNGRIGADEKLNDEEGLSETQLHEIKAEREAKARATILEIVGDLPHADVAPPENVLFVCKLNPVTTDEDLEIIFGRYGKVKSCEVIRDHQTGDSLQYAFVEFEDQKSCEQAYLKMDNVLIDDRRIHVDFSQSVSKIKWRGKGLGVQYFDKPEDKDNTRSVERHSGKRDYYRDRDRERDRGDRSDRRRDDDRRRRGDRDVDDYRRRERRKTDDSRRREDDTWRDDDRWEEDRKRRDLREERRRDEDRKYSSRREDRRREEDRRRDVEKRRNGTEKKESSSSRRGENHNDDKRNEKTDNNRSKEAQDGKEDIKHESSKHSKEKIEKIDLKNKETSSDSQGKLKEQLPQKGEIDHKNNSDETQQQSVIENDRSFLDTSAENDTPEKSSSLTIKEKKKKRRKPSTSSESSSSDSVDTSSSSSSLDQKRKRKHNVTVAKKYYHRGKLVKIIKKKKNESSDSESSEESSDSDRRRKKTKYKKIVKVIKKRRRTSTDDSDTDSSSSEDTDSSRPRKKKRKNDKNMKKKKRESKRKKKKKVDPSESSFSEDDKFQKKGKSSDVKKQKKELSD